MSVRIVPLGCGFFLAEDDPVSIDRRDDDLAHAVRLISRLRALRAAPDKFRT
jgi:hypothetical protein